MYCIVYCVVGRLSRKQKCQKLNRAFVCKSFLYKNFKFHKEFLTFSFLEDCQLGLLEKSQESQHKYFCQVLFNNKKTLTTEQDKISGKPVHRGIDIFPSRKMFSKCDTDVPTCLDLYLLTPYSYSTKEAYEFNASSFNTSNERTNSGEKYFDYHKDLQVFSHVEELIQDQTFQILGQSFEHNEHDNAFHDKATSIKC